MYFGTPWMSSILGKLYWNHTSKLWHEMSAYMSCVSEYFCRQLWGCASSCYSKTIYRVLRFCSLFVTLKCVSGSSKQWVFGNAMLRNFTGVSRPDCLETIEYNWNCKRFDFLIVFTLVHLNIFTVQLLSRMLLGRKCNYIWLLWFKSFEPLFKGSVPGFEWLRYQLGT